MQKEIFILKGKPSEGYKEFKWRMFELMDRLRDTCDPEMLKICLTENKPPLFSVIPFKRQKAASLSISTAGNSHHELIANTGGYAERYRVVEVLPVKYEKHWPDKTVTPGVCLLTLFHRKPSIDHKIFLNRWFNGHTPLSLRLHPLWHYSRNEVVEKPADNPNAYDGIVDEHFRKASDLLNPMVFFGPPLKAPFHMLQVLKDTRGFIDMKRIETYLAAEYVWVSGLL